MKEQEIRIIKNTQIEETEQNEIKKTNIYTNQTCTSKNYRHNKLRGNQMQTKTKTQQPQNIRKRRMT